MIKMVEMDAAVSIRDQLGDDSADPVILVNVIHAPPGEIEALVAAWSDDAHYFKGQPGSAWCRDQRYGRADPNPVRDQAMRT